MNAKNLFPVFQVWTVIELTKQLQVPILRRIDITVVNSTFAQPSFPLD